MPVAYVVGLGRHQALRIESFAAGGHASYRSGWDIHYLPARRTTPEITVEDIPDILGKVAGSDNSHVIGVSTQDGKVRQQIKDRIREFFRFRWLDNRLLAHLHGDFARFIEGLNAALLEEESWAELVKPKDIYCPLLLPRMCFACHVPHTRIWELAEQFGDIQIIHAAGAAQAKFSARFWSGIAEKGHYPSRKKWLDMADRAYDPVGARHAIAPFPRNWKYSYKLEERFHFDVEDRNKGAFKFTDQAGMVHKVKQNGYLNVDPHGYVR